MASLTTTPLLSNIEGMTKMSDRAYTSGSLLWLTKPSKNAFLRLSRAISASRYGRSSPSPAKATANWGKSGCRFLRTASKSRGLFPGTSLPTNKITTASGLSPYLARRSARCFLASSAVLRKNSLSTARGTSKHL